MKVLYNTQTQGVSPYPRNDDEPVIGLSPEYLVLVMIESDPPSPTAIPSWEVNLETLEYCQVWTEPEPPPPAPDWEKFIQQFTLPGNPLYHATASKVQISGELVIEHWTNIRLGLLSPSIRNEEWFQLIYDYLKFILNQAGNPLSTEEQQAWTQLASECNIALV